MSGKAAFVTAEDMRPLVLSLQRSGQPPIRIKGRLVTRHVAGGEDGEASLDIALFARASGGFAVAARCGKVADASAVADLAGAMDFLEAMVAAPPHAAGSERFEGDPIDALASEIAARCAWRDFAVLAGDAMAEWDRMARPGRR